jgi:hypothetical protein
VILSTRAQKWLRGKLEKWAGTFYDGPKPPERLREHIIMFANANPKATRVEWADFAIKFSESVFQSAYVRGIEHSERDPDIDDGRLPPDMIADQMDPDWRWRPEVVLELPHEIVPDTRAEEAVIRETIAAVNLRARRF